jgi:hypothetical protein
MKEEQELLIQQEKIMDAAQIESVTSVKVKDQHLSH